MANNITQYWHHLTQIVNQVDQRPDAGDSQAWQDIKSVLLSAHQKGIELESLSIGVLRNRAVAMFKLIRKFNNELDISDPVVGEFVRLYIPFLTSAENYRFQSKRNTLEAAAINRLASSQRSNTLKYNHRVAERLQTKLNAFEASKVDAVANDPDPAVNAATQLTLQIRHMKKLFEARGLNDFSDYPTAYLPEALKDKIQSFATLKTTHQSVISLILKSPDMPADELYERAEGFLTDHQKETWADNKNLHSYISSAAWGNYLFSFARYEDKRRDPKQLLTSWLTPLPKRLEDQLALNQQAFKDALDSEDFRKQVQVFKTLRDVQFRAIQSNPDYKETQDKIKAVITICHELEKSMPRQEDRNLVANMRSKLMDPVTEPNPNKRLENFKEVFVANHGRLQATQKQDVVDRLLTKLRAILKIKLRTQEHVSWRFWPDKANLHMERIARVANIQRAPARGR